MAKTCYNKCCIDKIYDYIYEKKNKEYNFVECCNHVYYLLPHKIEDLEFFLTREKNEDQYYFVTKDKKMIKVYKLNEFKDKTERDMKIKETIKSFVDKEKEIVTQNEN